MAGCRRAKYKGGRQKSTIRRPTGGVIPVRGHGAIRTGARARAKPEFVKAIMWDCCEHFLGSVLEKNFCFSFAFCPSLCQASSCQSLRHSSLSLPDWSWQSEVIIRRFWLHFMSLLQLVNNRWLYIGRGRNGHLSPKTIITVVIIDRVYRAVKGG